MLLDLRFDVEPAEAALVFGDVKCGHFAHVRQKRASAVTQQPYTSRVLLLLG